MGGIKFSVPEVKNNFIVLISLSEELKTNESIYYPMRTGN